MPYKDIEDRRRVCRENYYKYKVTRQQRVKQRRAERKQQLVDILGGCCSRCGYNACIVALEFHHRDPITKDLTLDFANRSMENLMKEIQKCILLCANCHREAHWVEKVNRA